MIRYEIVSAFASGTRPGAPLAVVSDGAGLADRAMCAIAAELGVLETAFVLPPASGEVSCGIRVFTPGGELGGAGHASVGTAATLVRRGLVPPGQVVLECGDVRYLLEADDTRATLVGNGPPLAGNVDAEPALHAVRLSWTDMADVARCVGFGGRFPLLAVNHAAVGRARPDYEAMRASGIPALCVFAWDRAMGIARARVFAPGFGIPEDPGCAPVALAIAVYLAQARWLPAGDGTYPYLVRQGDGDGRAGVVSCTVSVRGGQIERATATGDVVSVARGEMAIPAQR
jgi:trans-2,3-dihydro-3-hydroxyanthranilate isomerase